jgi:hypothetical protein
MKYNNNLNVLNCIDTNNYEGIRTVFAEARRAQKAQKHPELRLSGFIERVKKTIEKPDFIYEDIDGVDRRACYCREFKINSRIRYTKVILLKLKTQDEVITAYRPDYVKERGKTALIYGTDND